MTHDERAIVLALTEIWRKFAELPVLYSMETDEFCRAIHLGQQIIAARPTIRAEGWVDDRC